MKQSLKILIKYWAEIVLGIIIINIDDLRWFIFYFFIIFILIIEKHTDFLRKLVRVFQVFNEVKLLSIVRKLKISDDEISIVMENEKKEIGIEAWAEIEKDFRDIKK